MSTHEAPPTRPWRAGLWLTGTCAVGCAVFLVVNLVELRSTAEYVSHYGSDAGDRFATNLTFLGTAALLVLASLPLWLWLVGSAFAGPAGRRLRFAGSALLLPLLVMALGWGMAMHITIVLSDAARQVSG